VNLYCSMEPSAPIRSNRTKGLEPPRRSLTPHARISSHAVRYSGSSHCETCSMDGRTGSAMTRFGISWKEHSNSPFFWPSSFGCGKWREKLSEFGMCVVLVRSYVSTITGRNEALIFVLM
jgi:hypothetical protein